jgi:hypothetical protein
VLLKVPPSIKLEFPQCSDGTDGIRMKLLSLDPLVEVPIMKRVLRKVIVGVFTLGLLSSCAQTGVLEVQNDMSIAAKASGIFPDTDSIERWYENISKELITHLWSPCGRCCLARTWTTRTVSSSSEPWTGVARSFRS